MSADKLALPDTRPDLISLARDRSRAGRLQLVEMLVAAYLKPGQELSATEASQFSDFVGDLFSGAVPFEVRQLLADRAQSAKCLPPSVVRQLAADEISIAGPILSSSPLLIDRDLLAVIGLKKTPHQLAIAGREQVSETIADALVLTGNPDVVGTLLKNFGARFNRRSIDKCIEFARQIHTLRAALIVRPEFTAADASKLMPWLPRELRQVIITRFGGAGTRPSANGNINNNSNAKSLQETVDDMLARYRETPPTEREAEFMVAWLSDRGAINGTLLVQALRTRSIHFYTSLMARLLRLPLPLVQYCMDDRKGQLLAVLSRAIGMEKTQFASSLMLVMANEGQAVSPGMLDEALQAYDRLTDARAATMIRAWRDNPDLLRARG